MDRIGEDANGDIALLTFSAAEDAVASGSSTPVKDSSTSTSGVKGRSKWKEAALRAKQGLHNIDFTRHPRAEAASRAYLILHHPAFYITHLVVSVLLMLLALAEWPTLLLDDSQAYRNWFLPIHGSVEVLLLSFLLLDFVLRMIWLGRQFYSLQSITVYTFLILVVMYIEAVAVLVRQETHFRVLRALRPVFFINTHLMFGVQRVVQQVFLCLKPISDVLLLLLFQIAFFSIIGYYIFNQYDKDYFGSFGQSFVSLFILLSTANHPDVLMESYHASPASPIFFMCYLIVTLYVISNVLLGVVYSSFKSFDTTKFKSMFLHKRKALSFVYNQLAGLNGIELSDFEPFMKEFQPQMPAWQVLCVFKALKAERKMQMDGGVDRDNVGFLSIEQFYELYRIVGFKWKEVRKKGKRCAQLPEFVRSILRSIYKLVSWHWFNSIISVIIIFNTIFVVVNAAIIDPAERFSEPVGIKIGNFIFIGIYCFEILLRIVGYGVVEYFGKFWNWFDFIIILASLIAQFMEINSVLKYAILLRPLRLLRLLRLKRRYRDILDAVGILSPQLLSVALLLVVVYYGFAIIGMEVFHKSVFPQCCNDSWFYVGGYYSGVINSTGPNVYWLNNFDSIFHSYVTLFELMVINNWFVIMEGFASQASTSLTAGFTRLYFMTFYTVTLVTSTVIISYIVEAFVFKITTANRNAKLLKFCKKNHVGIDCNCSAETDRVKRMTVEISLDDIDLFSQSSLKSQSKPFLHSNSFNGLRKKKLSLVQESTIYHGYRLRNREDLLFLMYEKEIPTWLAEYQKDHCADTSQGMVTQSADNSNNADCNSYLQSFKTSVMDFLEYLVE